MTKNLAEEEVESNFENTTIVEPEFNLLSQLISFQTVTYLIKLFSAVTDTLEL